jgi:hypothetical protein
MRSSLPEARSRDQQEARHMADVFNREYKPDVQLRYVDEFGRNMNLTFTGRHALKLARGAVPLTLLPRASLDFGLAVQLVGEQAA